MTVHLILSIDHTGRPSRPRDMGASYDLDSDGIRGENGEREVDLVTAYVAAAVERCSEIGMGVTVLQSGEYGARHLQAAAIARGIKGRVAYCSAHTNAGRGTYGLVRPDARSAAGGRLAASLAAAFGRLPELSRCRTDPLYPSAAAARALGRKPHIRGDGSEDWGWWTRGHVCIRDLYVGPANLSGVLVEPGFPDSPAHRSLWTPAGLVRVGRALVDGVRGWE